MLRRCVRWSLHRPRLIVGACLVLLVLGGVYASRLRLDLLPNTAPVQATIETESPGLVAEQVEGTVTSPIERVLLGAPGVASVESRSAQGLSVITVRFAPGANPTAVRGELTEDLAHVGAFPPGVSAPRLSPAVAPGGPVMILGLTSATRDPMSLRDLAQWVVRPRLLSTRGVADVAIWGGQIRRVEVQARPGDLADSDLGFLDIVAATRRATSVAGAGFIDTPNQRVLIEPRGQAETLDAVKAGQIQTPGAVPTRIDDVADVVEGPAPAIGDALIDGKPGVVILISRAPDAGVVETTRAIDATVAQLRPALAAEGVALRADLDRPASFVEAATAGLVRDLVVGLALVAVALAVFMRDLRMTLLTLAAVPLTLVASLAVLRATGLTLNAMTLGGLAVALGLVIDDAVIDVESIVSDLRGADAAPADRRAAILKASLEVRAPVLYATAALALALTPLLVLKGPQQALLAPLAATIIVAGLASAVVAVAVTPALALLLLRHVRPAHEPGFVRRAKAAQARWHTWISARPLAALVAAAAVTLAIGSSLFVFRGELMPSIHDSHLVFATDAPASTSLEAVRAADAALAADLRAVPGVRAVSQRIGRDATSVDGAGIEHSVVDLALDPDLDDAGQAALRRRIRARLADQPGGAPTVASRFDAGQTAAAGFSGLRIRVFGPDSAAIDLGAARVRQALDAMPGRPRVVPVADEVAPVVRVDLDFNKLALVGLSAADVLDTVQAAFAGQTVAHLYEGPRIVDLAVSAQTSLRRDPESVGDLLVRSSTGYAVPLRSIANVYLTEGRAVIAHSGGLRRALIEAAPQSGDLGRFADEVRAAVTRQAPLPPGVFLDYQIVNSAAEADRNLTLAYGLGFLAVLAFLTVALDAAAAVLILSATLFGLAGGVVAIALRGGGLSIGEMAGLAAVAALSMRGAILVVSRAEDLAKEAGAPMSLSTAIAAAGERLVPGLSAAGLIVLALAPFAVHAGAPGREIIGPMAIVIIAGVLTATLGALFVLPALVVPVWRSRRPAG